MGSTVPKDLCTRKGFRGGALLEIFASPQLLVSSHVRARDRGILAGTVCNRFSFGQARGEIVPCRFCGGLDGDGHPFWDCPCSPLVLLRESPAFVSVTAVDKSQWARCLLCHG